MEHAETAPSIFRLADLGLIADRLFRPPVRLRRETAGLLAVLAVGLGALGDALFVHTLPGINLPLWHAAVIGAMAGASRPCGVRLAPRQLGMMALSFALSCCIAWRGSEGLQALTLLGAMFLMMLAVSLPPRVGAQRMGFVTFVYALVTGGVSMATGALRLLMLLPRRERLTTGSEGSRYAVLRASLLALPLVVVFGGLFVAADAVLESQLKSVLNPDLEGVAPHIFWFGASLLAAAGVLWAALGFEAPAAPEAELPEPRRLRALETGIVLGTLALLFAVFVGVQVRYLFGGSDLVQSTAGLTYAEYARRGFFELVAVAALLLPVLLAVNWARRRDSRGTLVYRLLAVVLVLLLAVVMASALERLRIYTDAFGLTAARFYPAAFLVSLAAVFVCFLATVLRDRVGDFLWGVVVIGAVSVIAINVVAPDALIARTNTSRLDDGRSFDAVYAATLGADAVPVLVERLGRLAPADRCVVASALLREWVDADEEVRGWNYGRLKAAEAVRENEAALRAAC